MKRGKCINCGQASVKLTEEDAALVETLRARIKVLEGHRNTWRNIAYRLFDIASKHEPETADAVFADPTYGEPSMREGSERQSEETKGK